MATPETMYKSRMRSFFPALAERCNLEYWSTALGIGHMAGIPDSWLQFGSVAVFWEAKKKSKAARKLQAHRIQQLNEMGHIAFCTSADPDSTGVKGEERKAVLNAILDRLSTTQIDARVLQYRRDTTALRKQITEMLDE